MFWFSRWREYRADAGGAHLAGRHAARADAVTRWPALLGLLLGAGLLSACTGDAPPPRSQDVTVLAQGAEGFEAARRGVSLQFPRDHGSHPGYRIEWWYLTANLRDAEGRPYDSYTNRDYDLVDTGGCHYHRDDRTLDDRAGNDRADDDVARPDDDRTRPDDDHDRADDQQQRQYEFNELTHRRILCSFRNGRWGSRGCRGNYPSFGRWRHRQLVGAAM